MNGTWGMGVATPIKTFSLEDAPQLAVGFFTPNKLYIITGIVNPL
jgi:hypothetical protein